ncbi:hypothetical protein GN956_G17701 [Arapaima gigas]
MWLFITFGYGQRPRFPLGMIGDVGGGSSTLPGTAGHTLFGSFQLLLEAAANGAVWKCLTVPGLATADLTLSIWTDTRAAFVAPRQHTPGKAVEYGKVVAPSMPSKRFSF